MPAVIEHDRTWPRCVNGSDKRAFRWRLRFNKTSEVNKRITSRLGNPILRTSAVCEEKGLCVSRLEFNQRGAAGMMRQDVRDQWRSISKREISGGELIVFRKRNLPPQPAGRFVSAPTCECFDHGSYPQLPQGVPSNFDVYDRNVALRRDRFVVYPRVSPLQAPKRLARVFVYSGYLKKANMTLPD